MADKVKVRLTLQPGEPWEVDEDEIPVLRHQGLLIEDEPPPPVKAPTAKPAKPEGA